MLGKHAAGQFSYLNPVPGSKYHNRETTLAIRNGDFIDEASIRKSGWITITGSVSGTHSYTSRLSDDGKTIVVKPLNIFDFGETVSVSIHSSLKKKGGGLIAGKSFSFQIHEAPVKESDELIAAEEQQQLIDELGYDPSQVASTRDLDLDSLPSYTISVNSNPAPGEIFYNNQYDFSEAYTNCHNTIIENNGTVTYAKDMGYDGHDFKINFNGYITYFNYSSNYWIMLDSNYAIIDSFTAGNGYSIETNAHDCSVYSDGHAFLLIDDKQTMDLTQYGGNPAAKVTSTIIEELDANKDVVWEWSGWDHFQITDADSHLIITGLFVDYVHSNTILRDNDGNVLLSSRSLSEISKISHATGDFIWRLGGENNQFTFVNDNIPEHFSFQHDVKRIANGNITIFNNGNFLPVPRSSAKEYQLDEVNKIATLVWYYEHPDINGSPVYGASNGSVQRLTNDNTMISWGSSSLLLERPSMTEVDYNKNITWEMKFDEFGQKAYRTHKYVWQPCAPLDLAQVDVKKITATSAKIEWQPVKNAVSYALEYRKAGNTTWKVKTTVGTSRKLINLTPEKTYQFRLRSNCANGYNSDWTTIRIFTTLPARFTQPQIAGPIDFQVYPNPANDQLSIVFTGDRDQEVFVTVCDVTGREMFKQKSGVVTGENAISINVVGLPAGSYFVQVKGTAIDQTLPFIKE